MSITRSKYGQVHDLWRAVCQRHVRWSLWPLKRLRPKCRSPLNQRAFSSPMKVIFIARQMEWLVDFYFLKKNRSFRYHTCSYQSTHLTDCLHVDLVFVSREHDSRFLLSFADPASSGGWVPASSRTRYGHPHIFFFATFITYLMVPLSERRNTWMWSCSSESNGWGEVEGPRGPPC